jgi:acyl dehydratase
MGIVGAGAEVAWPCAVRPGDTLRVRSEVVEIIPSASRPDRARVSVRSQTLNQEGDVVQTTIARLLVFRRPQI